MSDPEDVHDRMIGVGKFLGRYAITRRTTAFLFSYSHPMLEQNILGINFFNPISLAAGFDKNAELIDILPSVGFGFMEVGSITGEPCAGNPKPRLWRLVKSKALVVYYGLKNDGAEAIAARLKNKKTTIPLGISIAKTNSEKTIETEAGISDYVKAYEKFINIGDYCTINISCPNAYGGQPFTNAESLEKLLNRIDTILASKPIFLKISPDLNHDEIDGIIEVAGRHKISGFICTNLTKNRNNEKIKDAAVPEKGGMSGKVVEELANELISYIYKKTNGQFVIIGCGGVFSAKDAYKKIRAGASLVQLITGMIYEGPQVISEINQGLISLLARDGFSNISEAVGADNR
ncbi:MAG: Dihydroorotate dehydrogenase 2 [Parcubacteria group bacterium GW2011_GWA2_46_9]|nr:MAG: Dihydroorotate dehydrogenase 2 [Parcubacteria group bacterium GW2011_GWA2_46_9]